MDNLGGILSVLLVGSLILAINFAPVPNEGALVLGLAAIALAALVAFYIRQKRAANPLYDLEIAGRRVFWVAACAGIIVFGSLMAAAFVSQQYLQNVLGYSTLEAGAAILPAALVMVVVAPRSAKLVEARGARFTLLAGYVFLLLAFLTMLLVWDEGAPYWQIAAAYMFVGAGVGLAGTPASHSLTGSVPVTRAGMASGTADLQRDLGGAMMQSIFGALLTAGYASAVASQIAASDQQITDSTQAQLTKSFAGAEAVAAQHPQYADAIIAGAQQAFLEGDDWAYTAGVVAILLGAVLVFFMFPKHEEEQQLLASYHEEDTVRLAVPTHLGAPFYPSRHEFTDPMSDLDRSDAPDPGPPPASRRPYSTRRTPQRHFLRSSRSVPLRVHRTSSSSSSTTSASRPRRAPSAAHARRRRPSASLATGSSSIASIRPRSARPTRQALLTGPEPPLGGDGRHHRARDLGARLQLDSAEHCAPLAADAQAERLLDGPVRQVPRGARLGDEPAGAVRRLAVRRSRLRALLRLPRRRDEPVLRRASTKDTVPVEPERTAEEGYHFTEDMTDHAIDWIRSQKSLMPDKPFFVYFAPGATHAPHHVPRSGRTSTRADFDGRLGRVARGASSLARRNSASCRLTRSSPSDTEEIPAWDDMSGRAEADARTSDGGVRRLSSSTPTTTSGASIDTLDDLEMLEDTLVYYIIGDNGASAEGTIRRLRSTSSMILNGAVRARDDRVHGLAASTCFGTPEAFNHYAVGWAHALDTPYQWTKQVASHWGGTRNGTIVSLAGRDRARRGEVRHAVPPRDRRRGHRARGRRPARSPTMRRRRGAASRSRASVDGYSFDDSGAADRHKTQYFEMFCNRGIYHEGWTAVTRHCIAVGMPAGAACARRRRLGALRPGRLDARRTTSRPTMPEKLRRAPGALPERGHEVQRAPARRSPLRALQRRPRREAAARSAATHRSCSAAWAA